MLELFKVPPIQIENFIFQQDQAPFCHNSRFSKPEVSSHMDWQRWMDGKHSYQAPQKYIYVYLFLGSCRATCVRYSQWIMNVEHSIQQIQEAVALIIPDILQNVWRYLQYCLDLCRDNKWAHEELLYTRKNCQSCLLITLFFCTTYSLIKILC